MERQQAIQEGTSRMQQAQSDALGFVFDQGVESAGGTVDTTPYSQEEMDALRDQLNGVVDGLRTQLAQSQSDDLSDKQALQAAEGAKQQIQDKLNQVIQILTGGQTPTPPAPAPGGDTPAPDVPVNPEPQPGSDVTVINGDQAKRKR